MAMANSTLMVQVFFLMSSFLLAHKLLLQRARGQEEGAVYTFFDTMINRIIRCVQGLTYVKESTSSSYLIMRRQKSLQTSKRNHTKTVFVHQNQPKLLPSGVVRGELVGAAGLRPHVDPSSAGGGSHLQKQVVDAAVVSQQRSRC